VPKCLCLIRSGQRSRSDCQFVEQWRQNAAKPKVTRTHTQSGGFCHVLAYFSKWSRLLECADEWEIETHQGMFDLWYRVMDSFRSPLGVTHVIGLPRQYGPFDIQRARNRDCERERRRPFASLHLVYETLGDVCSVGKLLLS